MPIPCQPRVDPSPLAVAELGLARDRRLSPHRHIRTAVSVSHNPNGSRPASSKRGSRRWRRDCHCWSKASIAPTWPIKTSTGCVGSAPSPALRLPRVSEPRRRLPSLARKGRPVLRELRRSSDASARRGRSAPAGDRLVAPHGDRCPDRFDDAEWPGSGEEAVHAGEHTAAREREDVSGIPALERVHHHHECERCRAEGGEHAISPMVRAGRGVQLFWSDSGVTVT